MNLLSWIKTFWSHPIGLVFLMRKQADLDENSLKQLILMKRRTMMKIQLKINMSSILFGKHMVTEYQAVKSINIDTKL